jgi:histidinol-phosphate phosphatase family protein
MNYQAVILVGGNGTRLKSVTGDMPKPMAKIGKKPVLEYLIELCVRFSYLKILLLCQFNPQKIIDHFGNGEEFGCYITYIIEEQPRGTGGALTDAVKFLNESFLILYGDVFADINIEKLRNFHTNKNADLTMVVHPNDHPYDSDIVILDEHERVSNIFGYPRDENLYLKNLVNAGVFYARKKIFTELSHGQGVIDLVKNLLPIFLKNEFNIIGYRTTEYIKDMGTPKRLQRVSFDYHSGLTNRLSGREQNQAIFLDRDGTINIHNGYISNPDELKLIPGAAQAVAAFNKSGLLTFCVTNQPVIARGEVDVDGLNKIHIHLETLLGKEGAFLNEIIFCPHHPHSGFEGERKDLKIVCNCRKPENGMIEYAIKKYNISRNNSWLIGDSYSDIIAAKKSGLKSILIETSNNNLINEGFKGVPDYKVGSLKESVNWITTGYFRTYNICGSIFNKYINCKTFIINGLSRSGKSFFSQVFCDYLKSLNFRVHLINLDGWLEPIEVRKNVIGVENRYRIKEINQFIKKFIDAKTPFFYQTNIPSIHNKSNSKSEFIQFYPNDILIVEGVISFALSLNCIENTCKLYIDCNEEMRRERFYEFYQKRGLEDIEILQIWEERLKDEKPVIINKISESNETISL